MPLYPLGISRRRDVSNVPEQAAETIRMGWSVAGDLACAFIDAPHQAVPPMLHASTLEAIHRRICVLPVRFGAAVRDEAEIHALLQERQEELLEHLHRLDRACEMGLRIVPPSPANMEAAVLPQPPAPLAYLDERRSHYQQTDASVERERRLVQQIVERLQGRYRQWRMLESSPRHPVRLAFLVEQDRATAFRSCLKDACDIDQVGDCAIVGPWPPYSFA